MTISNTQLIISVCFALLMGGTLAYLIWKKNRMVANQGGKVNNEGKEEPMLRLQLQAYERLILLADRIALPNLISRCHVPNAGIREMQALLTQQIRSEFEHNITQQIYVSAEAWEALRNLKDQNLLIIHQVASYLPEQSTGADLNKTILEMLMKNPQSSLHQVVADVLSFEAKKLMHA